MTMTRRNALATLMASLSGLLARPIAAGTEGRKIIVVGAGLAGLTAARELASRGADVTVIEARDRIGGRIWTSRLWPGLPMDMGASWIHGLDGNPMTRLAREAGATHVETSFDLALALDEKGAEIDISEAEDLAEKVLRAASRAAEKGDRDIPLKAAVEATTGWKSADAQQRRLIMHMIHAQISNELGSSWAETSTWYHDGGEAYDGEDAIFPDGYDQIIAHLARGLTIRQSAPVRAVAPKGEGVVVTLAAGERLTADHVVVTVPLGVLKAGHIEFAERLSRKRQAAIDTIGMGLLHKTWLLFDKVAWPDDVDWIEWVGPRPGFWSQWVSLARVKRAPVLLAFHGGDEARIMEALPDAAIMAEAHAALRAMFGNRFPAPKSAQISRWGQDRFALGAYSFATPGTTPKTRVALGGADWDGRLIFAGEACDPDYAGSAHASVRSGLAAAKRLKV